MRSRSSGGSGNLAIGGFEILVFAAASGSDIVIEAKGVVIPAALESDILMEARCICVIGERERES